MAKGLRKSYTQPLKIVTSIAPTQAGQTFYPFRKAFSIRFYLPLTIGKSINPFNAIRYCLLVNVQPYIVL